MSTTTISTRVDALLRQLSDVARAIAESDAEFGTWRLDEAYKKLSEELGSLDREALVPALLSALRTSAASSRVEAAGILGSLRAIEAAPDLLRGLSDPDDSVREASASALAILEDTSAIPSLIACLADASVAVRNAAIAALLKLGDAAAAGPIERLLDDPSSLIRREAAVALAGLDPAGGADAADAIERLFDDPEERVRITAVGLLAPFVSSPGRYEALARWAADPSYSVRATVYKALTRAPDRPLAERFLSPLLHHSNLHVRADAAAALARCGSDAPIPTLIELTRNPDRRLPISALEALGLIAGPEHLDPVLRALRAPDMVVRLAAVEALGSIAKRTGANVLQPLCDAATDADASVRRRAIDTLLLVARPGSPRDASDASGASDRDIILATVERALGDSDVRVVASAATMTQALGETCLVPALAAALMHARWYERNFDPVRAALTSFGDVAASALTQMLTHPDPARRERAAATLDQPIGLRLIDPLIRALEDPSPGVRANAAFALGVHDAKDARDALLRALFDEDPKVVSRAAQALGKIGDGSAGGPHPPTKPGGRPPR
jgi:HEAT repeat protein